MILNNFFRCPCGKLHTHGGLSSSSVCPQCGRDLWLIALTGDQAITVREHEDIRKTAVRIAKEMGF